MTSLKGYLTYAFQWLKRRVMLSPAMGKLMGLTGVEVCVVDYLLKD